MKIVLKRKIDVKKFKVIMDIGQKEKRTDIIAVLKIAQSHNEQLSIQIICGEFIFRDNETLAKRIIRRCQDLNLIDENLKLTNDGRKAIEDNEFYRPMKGVFNIWVTQDPLYPQKVLLCEMDEDKANLGKEIKQKREEMKNRTTMEIHTGVKIESTPDWLKPIADRQEIQLFDKEKSRIRIETIEDKVEPFSQDKALFASVIIQNEKTILKSEGLVEDSRQISYFPQIQSIWQNITSKLYTDWKWDEEAFSVSFEGLSDDSRFNFQKQYSEFTSVSIPNFNNFSIEPFEAFKIIPKKEKDAIEWAKWLFERKIPDFLYPNQFQKYQQEIQALFPNYTINLPSQSELAESIKTNQKKEKNPDFWFVNAPLDLKTNIR